MPKAPSKKPAEHLVRLDDHTYRAIVQLQLERVKSGGTRLTLGQVVAGLLKDRK